MKMATAASSSALFACSKCFSRHPFEELSQGQQLCKVNPLISKHVFRGHFFKGTCLNKKFSISRNAVVHFLLSSAPIVVQNSSRNPSRVHPAFAKNVKPMLANMANPPVVSIVISLPLLSTENAIDAMTRIDGLDHQRPVISVSKNVHSTGKIRRNWTENSCVGCARRATKELWFGPSKAILPDIPECSRLTKKRKRRKRGT